MLERVTIRNFKRFAELDLRLAPLSVLTGVNSGGKSSVIQGILLARSAVSPGTYVPLNGPFGLELGEATDVLHARASEPLIEIALASGGGVSHFVFDVPPERSTSLVTNVASLCADQSFLTDAARALQYLSAERLGPRDIQEVSPELESALSVGHQGQFTAHVISQLDRVQVDVSRRHPQTEELGGVITLSAQAEYWMSTIVCPIRFESTWIVGTNAAMLRFRPPDLSTEWLRPNNVGFGISYALPIVVAGLTMTEGGLLMVENPEAHLHPSGQSAMGRFLGRVAASGVQVLIETHSDHILNGLRRAVADDKVLEPSGVLIHYFGQSDTVAELEVDQLGAVSSWPDGFFDQSERDLIALARAKRRG